jgi:hypothetical protein
VSSAVNPLVRFAGQWSLPSHSSAGLFTQFLGRWQLGKRGDVGMVDDVLEKPLRPAISAPSSQRSSRPCPSRRRAESTRPSAGRGAYAQQHAFHAERPDDVFMTDDPVVVGQAPRGSAPTASTTRRVGRTLGPEDFAAASCLQVGRRGLDNCDSVALQSRERRIDEFVLQIQRIEQSFFGSMSSGSNAA